MDNLSYKTKFANKDSIQKGWLLVDAENETLGRLASKVAYLLRGKNKTSFTPNADAGDNVIVINAEKIKITGNKVEAKEYRWYTGYPGGQRNATPKEMLLRKPTFVVEHAITRMLPKSKLGNKLKRNIFIYAGSEHPHGAQQPKEIKLSSIK